MNFKSIAKKAGKACFDFGMLNEGDRILICFSGGKDSYVLVKVLDYLKRTYPIDFELKALTINPNFDLNFEKNIREILEKENIEFEIINSQIKEVLEKQLLIKEFRPCFMCSRLRRGLIYDYAIKNGFNKIALGHNLDDAIETYLMNFFYSSKTSFLKPKYLAENSKVEVIRPLIYIDEDIILNFIEKIGYIPTKDNCPLKEKSLQNSKRDFFKKLLSELKEDNPKIKESAYHAFKNIKELNEW